METDFVEKITLFLSIAVGTPVALGAILDLAVGKKLRNLVAYYVFGFEDRPFREFESHAIAALLSPLMKDGRLAPLRIVIVFFVINEIFGRAFFGALTEIIGDLSLPEDVTGLQFGPTKTSKFFFLASTSIVFDWISLLIKKRIFVDRVVTFPMTIPWVATDLFLSSGAYWIVSYVILTVSFQLTSGWILAISQFFAIALASSALSASIISILQIFFLSVGVIFRSILVLTRVNRIFMMHTEFIGAPFTFCGFFFGVILATIKLISVG